MGSGTNRPDAFWTVVEQPVAQSPSPPRKSARRSGTCHAAYPAICLSGVISFVYAPRSSIRLGTDAWTTAACNSTQEFGGGTASPASALIRFPLYTLDSKSPGRVGPGRRRNSKPGGIGIRRLQHTALDSWDWCPFGRCGVRAALGFAFFAGVGDADDWLCAAGFIPASHHCEDHTSHPLSARQAYLCSEESPSGAAEPASDRIYDK